MSFDPASDLMDDETTHLFLCFCTFVMNLKGKKLSIQNVFVQTLQDEKLKAVMKGVLSLESDYELVKTFLDFDGGIAKSKFVTKWSRSNNQYIKKNEKKRKIKS